MHWDIAENCPGCGVRLLGGAICNGLEHFFRTQGLGDDEAAEDGDAVYVGDLVINNVLNCPRCGTNCMVEVEPPPDRPERGDDRAFLEESVVDLEFSIRSRLLIHRAGAVTAADLLALTRNDLRAASEKDCESQIAEIVAFLAERGLVLRGE